MNCFIYRRESNDMELFGGILAVKAVVFLTFSIFAIAAVGYSIGRIEVKGIDLGTAGVFIVALVYGYEPNTVQRDHAI